MSEPIWVDVAGPYTVPIGEVPDTPWNGSVAVGIDACAIGRRAVAYGTDAVALWCRCGFELNGRAAAGQARVEAVALWNNHADRCEHADPV